MNDATINEIKARALVAIQVLDAEYLEAYEMYKHALTGNDENWIRMTNRWFHESFDKFTTALGLYEVMFEEEAPYIKAEFKAEIESHDYRK